LQSASFQPIRNTPRPPNPPIDTLLCVRVCEMPGHDPLHRWQCRPVIMLQLTGHRVPDRQSLWAGFGLRAGLCRPLV